MFDLLDIFCIIVFGVLLSFHIYSFHLLQSERGKAGKSENEEDRTCDNDCFP